VLASFNTFIYQLNASYLMVPLTHAIQHYYGVYEDRRSTRYTSLVDQQWSQFSYVLLAAPLLGSVIVFVGAISTQFFTTIR